MRLILLTCLTMVAFASNSILNRMALAEGQIGAVDFGVIRIVAGAVMLAALVLWRERRLPLAGPYRVIGVASLTLYFIGFSLAYLGLDAGPGALILFGGVQITMFAGALIGGEVITPMRWVGAALAFAGLTWLLWPTGASVPDLGPAALMAVAALGWGIYSLVGRKSGPALIATSANFVLTVPVALLIWLVLPGSEVAAQWQGVALAILCGAVTSGLGYAMWYQVLPQLSASGAALAQLSVPVIAAIGGLILLTEPVTLRFVLASLLVLGGIALGIRRVS